ncbi:MAG: glutamate-1-semialdehyde-2,1-aminomutase [Acidobacteria bacterium]|nr:MAG: glutamate-1-semialdehyde-2,1-aminomutase [Acidobacteriota bacterium]
MGSRSQELQHRAEAILPGGVDSPVRSFRAVGGAPPWIERGAGAWLYDADGKRYLDFIASWGALLLGHAAAEVVAAVQEAAAKGTSFGASTPAELELAELVQRAYPACAMLRFVNSGTEATMSAVRVARGFTGRNGVIKFAGGYHGHADTFLCDAGSGLATLGVASSAGVPPGAVADTVTLPYNDAAAVEQALEETPGRFGAIIVEPVAGNMGCVPPEPDFLPGLRRLADRHGVVLIFDEVMTGFRVAWGGAAARYGVTPDMATLGKIIGGGLPVGAYGGRADLMRRVAPLGPVYQAGTLSGNPLAMAAGVATLKAIAGQPNLYANLEQRGAQLEEGVNAAIAATGAAARVQRVGAMLTVFFSSSPVRNFTEVSACDTAAFARFHAALLQAGVLWPPSQFEAAFFGAVHGSAEMEQALGALRTALGH